MAAAPRQQEIQRSVQRAGDVGGHGGGGSVTRSKTSLLLFRACTIIAHGDIFVAKCRLLYVFSTRTWSSLCVRQKQEALLHLFIFLTAHTFGHIIENGIFGVPLQTLYDQDSKKYPYIKVPLFFDQVITCTSSSQLHNVYVSMATCFT